MMFAFHAYSAPRRLYLGDVYAVDVIQAVMDAYRRYDPTGINSITVERFEDGQDDAPRMPTADEIARLREWGDRCDMLADRPGAGYKSPHPPRRPRCPPARPRPSRQPRKSSTA